MAVDIAVGVAVGLSVSVGEVDEDKEGSKGTKVDWGVIVGEGVMLDDAQVEGVIEGVGEGVADKDGEGELERVPGLELGVGVALAVLDCVGFTPLQLEAPAGFTHAASP